MPKHKHGSGSVYRRGRVWWLSYYANGQHVSESSHSRDKGAAKEMLQSRLGSVAEGRYLGIRADHVTLDELAQDMLNDYRINAKKSLKDAERAVKTVVRLLGGRQKAQLVGPTNISAYVAQRQADGLTNGSINRELAALKRMYNLGLRNGKIIRKPHIDMLQEDNVRTGFFEWEQFQAVHARLAEHLQTAMLFAYLTGWRVRSEVLRLIWSNVDFKAGTVRLEPGTTKNKKGRLIYMTAALKMLLEHQRQRNIAFQREHGRIVPLVFHNHGNPIRNYYKAWHKACRLAGLAGRIPHDFRRTAVRNLVRAGIPERVAMEMTGHKTRSVFDRYHIVSEGDLREAALKLSAVDLATNLATVDPLSSGPSNVSPQFSIRATLAQSVEQLIRNQ
jgi:integrase